MSKYCQPLTMEREKPISKNTILKLIKHFPLFSKFTKVKKMINDAINTFYNIALKLHTIVCMSHVFSKREISSVVSKVDH